MKTFAIDKFQDLVEHSILSTLPSIHSDLWGWQVSDFATATKIVRDFGGTDKLWAQGATVEQAAGIILNGAA